MAIPTLPPYSTPPSSSDPANFAARADVKVAQDVTFVNTMNAQVIPGINQAVEDVEQGLADTEAAIAAANAAGLADAATNAALAQTARTGAEAARTGAEAARDVALQAAADAEAAAGVIPPVTGNAGKVLKVNPTGTGTLWENADVRMVTEYLTSGTSWTAPAALVGGRVKYRMTGGGGGGGRSNSGGNAALVGGDAGYCEGLATVTAGSSYSYSIGAGGTGGATTTAAGTNGGSSTMFGATAGGGLGSSGTPPGADRAVTLLGGSATGGDINVPGGPVLSVGPTTIISWTVGGAPFGRAGAATFDAIGYGVGGRGGTSSLAGQDGRPGMIVLEYLVRV